MKQKVKITRSEKVRAFEKAMNDAFTKIGDMTAAEMYTCLSVLAFGISRNVLDPEMTEIFGKEEMVQEVVNLSIAYGGLGAYTAAKDAFPDVDVECASLEKISDSDNCCLQLNSNKKKSALHVHGGVRSANGAE